MISKIRLLIACAAMLVTVAMLSGCKTTDRKDDQKETGKLTTALPDEPTEVRAVPIKRALFHFELVSNGIVTAQRKADLAFKSAEVVTHIFVKNGDRVTNGQKLATLDDFKLCIALEQAVDNLERSRLELQDVLIGQGYSLKEQVSIPVEMLKLAKIKSNYDLSRISYQLAEYNLKSATLYAPFAGVIANLKTKENNTSDGTSPFCTLFDMEHPEVNFNILENELPQVNLGDAVLVSPFSISENFYRGNIREINPLVDKNGMVAVKAVLDNASSKLYDGMNVRVRVQRASDKQLMIPKSALVLRNNRKVVFTCKNGLAQWVYVQTSMENSESYVVTEGLQEGDSVIYEGNFNLAHESPINVR